VAQRLAIDRVQSCDQDNTPGGDEMMVETNIQHRDNVDDIRSGDGHDHNPKRGPLLVSFGERPRAPDTGGSSRDEESSDEESSNEEV
jgi:hypothetical protein